MLAALLRFVLIAAAANVLISGPSHAQQQSLQRGAAMSVNLVATARTLRMQEMYPRALYLFLRNNPVLFDNPQFYATFVAYLLAESEGFDCRNAFANEFERRDFFRQADSLKAQVGQAIGAVQIPQSFDIAFRVDTGNYEFTNSNLPFSRVGAIGLRESLSNSINAGNASNCARQVLSGTSVDTSVFPWSFEVVNEAAERQEPRFPFGNSLQLSDADARLLFNRFGRQLYSVVSYRFQAATNGERKVQIVPTDGQLFGLSSDAVVRVKSFQHPSFSQANYLDITNPLVLLIPDIGLNAQLQFEQQGFRAVGSGTSKDPGTDITAGGEFPVQGSAAVGNSVFIMRLASSRLRGIDRYGRTVAVTPGQEQFVTLFGSVDFERATATAAPVSGVATMLSVDPQSGSLEEGQAMRFRGKFVPADVTQASETQPDTDESQLDTSPVVTDAPSE